MNTLYFDIETVPTTDERTIAAIRAEIETEKESITAPANYKDADKIAAYIAEKSAELDKAFDSRLRMTALNGARGHIYCISAAVDEGDVKTFYHEDEAETIKQFFAFCKSRAALTSTFCGHNIVNFDLPFIFQRVVILGIKPPLCIPFQAKPWDNRVFDTMVKWCGVRGEGSMDAVCNALGIDGKGDISGKNFYDAVLAGRHEDCLTYCAEDVERTRLMFKRMTFAA
jgi:3'-5' exonuclease